MKRLIGPMRSAAIPKGLTRTQAERELRRLMVDVRPPAPRESMALAQAGQRYVNAVRANGRKRSTVEAYESYLRVHLVPFFAATPISRIGREDVDAFIQFQTAKGLAPKSVRLHLSVLHGVFSFGEKRGWVDANPCTLADKPQLPDVSPDIRWLNAEELEALLHIVSADTLGEMERVLYLTAAMTGLRQGELLALRWLDIDWLAARVRVRRNYVRGQYGTPKSRRGSRSIPLADRVAAELERHFRRSAYTADDDLVFCHPDTGKPYDRSKLLKRFKAALRAAGVREVRFHDLRHTFGTRMAGAGVAMRTLQEWMGHRDFKTTLIYADYAPSEREAELIELAFGAGTNSGTKLGTTQGKSNGAEPLENAA